MYFAPFEAGGSARGRGCRRAAFGARCAVACVTALLCLIVPARRARAQEAGGPEARVWGRALVVYPDNAREEVRDLTLEATRIEFRRSGRADRLAIELERVSLVRVDAGNRALRYGLMSAGASAILSMLTYAARDEAGDELPSFAPVVLGVSVVSGAIGAIVGSRETVWRTIHPSAPTRAPAPHPGG